LEIKIETQKLALPNNGRIGQDHLAKIFSLGTDGTTSLGARRPARSWAGGGALDEPRSLVAR